MSDNKLTLDDIFNNDEFGILDAVDKQSTVRSDDQRMIDEFEEINSFYEKNKREPSSSAMSEYVLMARLKKARSDQSVKEVLKPYDKFDLLGPVTLKEPTLDEILADDSGILDTSDNLDIFRYRNIPKEEERAKTDFVAVRKPMGDREFAPYETIFHRVHQDLKEGRRHIITFKDPETQLKEKHFYFIDGVMLYLEKIGEDTRQLENLKYNTTRRKDFRTRTIFENGTISNMYFRSVAKAIYAGGAKMVSNLDEAVHGDIFESPENISDDDNSSGWVYILKSKSQNAQLRDIENLYKIGYSSTPVEQRIKNAKNEATYLFDDVKIVNTYEIYNLNARKFEKLLHKVFGKVCLDIEFETPSKIRVNPREWFVVPKEIIEQAILLIASDEILNFEYDPNSQRLVRKQ